MLAPVILDLSMCHVNTHQKTLRAKTLIIGQTLSTIGFAAIVCTPPFGVVIAAFFFLGLGMAINLALSNVFAANLHNSTKMLGIVHGSYGIGGTIGISGVPIRNSIISRYENLKL